MKRVWEFYRDLLWQNRGVLRKVIILFLVSIAAGAVLFFYDQTLLDKIVAMFEEKFGADRALDLSLAIDIFRQNLIASLIALIGGVILGITPVLLVGLNGLLLGYVVTSIFVLMPGSIMDSLTFASKGLLPHAIFEVPEFLIVSAFGLVLGTRWLKRESAGKRKQVLKEDFIKALKIVPLAIILLIAAALAEVFVSGNLIK
ncbi:MAG: stage II sporulation protein M [Candidatus Doudnabacteria bacterium]|nr:stage II sporulation protein M [Candidatus Doudnabacteria bacterium]